MSTQENVWSELSDATTPSEIRRILARGPPPNAENMYLSLIQNAAHGYVDKLQVLLDYGIDPNESLPDGMTPLNYAVLNATSLKRRGRPVPQKYFDTFRILIEAGADPNIKNSKGYSPIDYAKEFLPEALPILIVDKENVQYKESDLTPVFVKEKLINAYKELGINSSASIKDIRKVYLEKMKQIKQGKLKRLEGSLNAAYNLLKNKSLKDKYDDALKQSRKNLLAKIQELCVNENDPVSMNDFKDLTLEQLRRIYVFYPNTTMTIPNGRKATCYEEETLIGLRESGRTMRNPLTREPIAKAVLIEDAPSPTKGGKRKNTKNK